MPADEFKVIDARILQVVPLPAVLTDREENLTIALALCEFTIKWKGESEPVVKRDIFPVRNDCCIGDLPGNDAFYLLHAFGDLAHEDYMEVAPVDLLESSYDQMVEREQDRLRRWDEAHKETPEHDPPLPVEDGGRGE